jgi:signal transduction histidine kinase
VASVLAIALIAAVLLVTVGSYRSALAAHRLAADSITETSVSHATETYLAREREVMNEYLLRQRPQGLAELRADGTNFRSNLLKVGAGDTKEQVLVQRALVANEAFLAKFSVRSRADFKSVEAFRRLETQLDVDENAVLEPLRALRSLNEVQARQVAQSSDASGRRALMFAIVAGGLAIAGGLAFALYAVRLVRSIGFRNERLHELDRMKDDFVASVSHELRTPLTSIRGYLELLREGEAGELTGDQHDFVAIVERNADRLLRLVGDLLFVAQVDAGKIALERGPVDVEELVHQAVDAALPAATEKRIALDVDLHGLSVLHADRARLGQVLDNLISNALKFTPSGGNVAVRTAQNADAIVIEVSDNGMGMSAEDLAQLFQRFFRTESAGEQAIQGTGLGLAIVKAIVEAHDGAISVASVLGKGTVFRVELPLALALRPLAA